MVNFDCVYNIINDEEKRNVVTALIKEIEIYRNDESEYPLKRIGLNFPVFKDGGEVTELLWDKGNTVETYDLPDIEVLLVGHHGSKYSTGTTLLESVTPEAGVISVGDNSYGHPTEEALLRLTDAGMTVYRTDMQGNILITVD